MNKHIVIIRKIDKIVFDSIKNGSKSIETRAATDKYKKIEVGDILEFKCEDKHLAKEITKIQHFKTIDEMVKTISFKEVMPFVGSIEEMKEVYYSFPDYKEKIGEYGLLAFSMSKSKPNSLT